MNNVPIQAPLYPPNLAYGSNDCEAMTVLVELDEATVREVLDGTPFDFVSPHAWIEVLHLRTAFGVEPFGGGGVVVPARHEASGLTGGYYAYCYTNTDETIALGREPFGYPKKYAAVSLVRSGPTATGSLRCRSASIEVEVTIGALGPPTDLPPRYPHLLLQVLPAAEGPEVLLKRVIARDTSVNSQMREEFGAGTLRLQSGTRSNELEWLASASPVVASYASGQFRSAVGRVLETIYVSPELLRVGGAPQ